MIALAADHGGYYLKEAIKKGFAEQEHFRQDVRDKGEEFLKYLQDHDEKGNEREVEYNFSDGVGKISYNLAEQISNMMHLNKVFEVKILFSCMYTFLLFCLFQKNLLLYRIFP